MTRSSEPDFEAGAGVGELTTFSTCSVSPDCALRTSPFVMRPSLPVPSMVEGSIPVSLKAYEPQESKQGLPPWAGQQAWEVDSVDLQQARFLRPQQTLIQILRILMKFRIPLPFGAAATEGDSADSSIVAMVEPISTSSPS